MAADRDGALTVEAWATLDPVAVAGCIERQARQQRQVRVRPCAESQRG